MSSDRRRLPLRRRGYSMVALVVVLVVMNIAVAAALPLWSKVMQRDAEEELIFRGLQYAEAIRVFQARFSRQPTSLEELLELEPRCIRQLWTEPIGKDGLWEPILAGSGTDITTVVSAEGEETGDEAAFEESLSRSVLPGGPGEPRVSAGFADTAAGEQIGPIEGVRPTATGEATKSFLGQTDYRRWEFRAQMLAAPQVTPEGVPLSPRIDPSALGRPFPPWLHSVPGAPPHPEGEAEDAFGETETGEDDVE